MAKHFARIFLWAVLVAGVVSTLSAQDLASFEKRITVKTLANGLTVIVCERPEAPVFTFFTHVDVGSDREVPGITGLAHMFEHMAFKGTDKIGTNDYANEKGALDKVEQAYQAYDQEHRREVGRDDKKLAELEKAWKDAMTAAQKYVIENQFGELVEQNGGTNLNAFTDNEETGYFYSLPSNQVELWAYLESERFLHPVLREFYKERDVVHEERRLGESDPFQRLFEQFTAAAYVAHPYGQPVVGWPSDLESFSMTDARAYYKKYYVPSNMVVTLVGDVKGSEVMPMIETYFGRLPAGPKPEPLRTVEPPQNAERIVILHETSQPIFIEGYHKPSARDKDDAVYDALQDLMSNGRTSRLYRSLVRDKKIAAQTGGFNGFPGSKYPNMFVFFSISTPGHTPGENRDAIHAEIERLRNEDISDEELAMVKTRAKADLLRQLGDNQGLAFSVGHHPVAARRLAGAVPPRR
jgi:predicted Zn-dependent peptidase